MTMRAEQDSLQTSRSGEERFARIQPLLAYLSQNRDHDISLEQLAAQAKLSEFHLHRLFVRATGETPKQYAMRLRLGQAAVMLLTTRDSVLDVALACGFHSHEVFCRAFRQRFGKSPSSYRQHGFQPPTARAAQVHHAQLAHTIEPCLGLYRMSFQTGPERKTMNYEIETKDLPEQKLLSVTRRVPQSEIAKTIGETLPLIFVYAQKNGIAIAGLPLTRYPDMSPGLVTLEPAMRIADASTAPGADDADVEVKLTSLPAGPAVATLHRGPYDTLHHAYAALQKWMEAEGRAPAGPPWEEYLTDPGEHPNPEDWRTEVYWPLKA